MNLNIVKLFLLIFSIAGGLFISLYPQSNAHIEKLKSQIPGFYSSFQGNLTFVYGSGVVNSGKIYYQYPNKLRVKLSSGRLILTDGKFLWMCTPSKLICFKQDVDSSLSSGGIFNILDDYEGKKEFGHYIFTALESENEKKIIMSISNKMLKSVKWKSKKNNFTVSFSNLIIGASLKSSLFYYKDSNAQILENPLNN